MKIAFFKNFANFWRARSRLYQNEILQENMGLTAFLKLYKICTLLHRCNLKILAKNRFEKSAIFVKIQQNFANVAKFAKCRMSNVECRRWSEKRLEPCQKSLQRLSDVALCARKGKEKGK